MPVLAVVPSSGGVEKNGYREQFLFDARAGIANTNRRWRKKTRKISIGTAHKVADLAESLHLFAASVDDLEGDFDSLRKWGNENRRLAGSSAFFLSCAPCFGVHFDCVHTSTAGGQRTRRPRPKSIRSRAPRCRLFETASRRRRTARPFDGFCPVTWGIMYRTIFATFSQKTRENPRPSEPIGPESV